jgi:O-antigen ligase
MGRAGGFFLQPNALAIGLAFLFVGWLALAKRGTVLREPIAILAFLGAELLTGSRTGIVLGICIVGLHLAYQWRAKRLRSAKARRLPVRLAILVVCVICSMVAATVFVDSDLDQIGHAEFDLMDRVSALLRFRLSAEGTELLQDPSLQARLHAQDVYWRLIGERPILGHGFGAETTYRASGDILMSSHSTMLAVTMECGIGYALLFFALLMFLLFSRHRGPVQHALGTNTVTQFVLVTLLVFVAAGNMFEQRGFFVVLGVVFTVVRYPWKVLAWDGSTGTYAEALSDGEVGHFKQNRRQDWASARRA